MKTLVDKLCIIASGMVVISMMTPQTSAAEDPPVFLLAWGSHGSGDGQFDNCPGVATDAAGDVYVADRGNSRIQKFSNTGTYLTQWGSAGGGDGQFLTLSGVATDADGDVYVADTDNRRIQKFSNTGTFIEMWGWGVDDGTPAYQVCTSGCQTGIPGSGDGQFNAPIAVATDAAGNVYVSDFYGNSRIQKFSNTGTYLTKWGSQGSGDGQFRAPSGVATDAAGDVYVSEIGNSRIQKFSNTGTYLTQWGSGGSGDGQFNSPYGLATDAAGDVYVSDSNNYRIQKFSNTGTYLTQWGSQGSGDGQFGYPYGVATEAGGYVYVADQGGNRIQKFGPATTSTEAVSDLTELTMSWPNPFATRTAIAFSTARAGRVRISIYDTAGRLLARPFDRVLGPGQHEATWDGRARDGSALPSGVYFYRLESDGMRITRQLVLTR